FDERWDAGLGAQFVGKRRVVAGNTVAGEGGHSADVYMPSFWLFNAAVGYQVNNNLNLRLTVTNISDEISLARGTYSSDVFQLYGGPGAGRTFILNAEARF